MDVSLEDENSNGWLGNEDVLDEQVASQQQQEGIDGDRGPQEDRPRSAESQGQAEAKALLFELERMKTV